MMITETPPKALEAGRFWGASRCWRFLRILSSARFWNELVPPGKTNSVIAQYVKRTKLDLSAVTDRLPSREQTAIEPPPTGKLRGNAPLESLAGGSLAARFHAWHGRSGQRYICSVFPVRAEASDAGLPDYADAVVIAVATDGDGVRHIVSLCQCELGANPYARECFLIEALAAGAMEWHIYLLATDMMQRHVVLNDLEATRRVHSVFAGAVAIAA